VRALFTFVGGSGHFEPLIPIARAVAEAGHAVAVACESGMLASVREAGFVAFAAGSHPIQSSRRLPLVPIDAVGEDEILREKFARQRARERVADLLPLCAKWQPDVVVRDEIDFGSAVAAERLGLPHANVLVIAAGSFVRKEVVGEALNELRAEYGLGPDPELAMLTRHLVLSPFPLSFRDPAFPLPITAHGYRQFVWEPNSEKGSPPWGERLKDAPIVYFTLGTIFNLESGDLFSRVLAGLRDLRIQVVVTVGRQIDPAELGPQPSSVHVARYIPQSSVLPHCDLVVSHAGSGSVNGALAYGRPMVLLPMGADQPYNAARCAELGIARVLDPVQVTPESVRETVSIVMSDPSYRRAAERMRDDLAALPPPEHAAMLVERLAGEKQPIH
jgi:UDP:flavonoid glycosyltransferase YjiC (YdhE family)